MPVVLAAYLSCQSATSLQRQSNNYFALARPRGSSVKGRTSRMNRPGGNMAAAESPCWRPMTSRGLCSCKIGQALVSLIPTPARINYVGWDHEQDPTHFPTHLPSPPRCLLACAVPLCSQLQTSQMNRSRSWRFLDLPPSALHRSSSPVASRTHACSAAWYACGQAAFSFSPQRPAKAQLYDRPCQKSRRLSSRPPFATRQSASIGL